MDGWAIAWGWAAWLSTLGMLETMGAPGGGREGIVGLGTGGVGGLGVGDASWCCCWRNFSKGGASAVMRLVGGAGAVMLPAAAVQVEQQPRASKGTSSISLD